MNTSTEIIMEMISLTGGDVISAVTMFVPTISIDYPDEADALSAGIRGMTAESAEAMHADVIGFNVVMLDSAWVDECTVLP
jgi:hypothetical protein